MLRQVVRDKTCYVGRCLERENGRESVFAEVGWHLISRNIKYHGSPGDLVCGSIRRAPGRGDTRSAKIKDIPECELEFPPASVRRSHQLTLFRERRRQRSFRSSSKMPSRR